MCYTFIKGRHSKLKTGTKNINPEKTKKLMLTRV